VAPEEVETGIQLHPWRQLRGQRRMEVEEVAGAERGFVAEVVAPRVEGIEGAEPVVVGIPVAAGDADEQRQSGWAASVFERMSGLGGQRPGTDAGIAETSPLDDGFPVPVPPVPLAERARTDGPAALACGSLDVAGQVIFVVQHVDVPGRGGCAAGGVDAAQYLRRRAGIVETARAVLPRGCGECIDAPGAVARIGADGLEAASHVGPLARVDQPCRAELQLLDADPHADAVVTSRCRSPFDEQVGRVEPVLVHRRRPRDAATGPRTGQLREAAPVLAPRQVGEGRGALAPGTPRVLWLQTVAGIAGVLVAPAQVAADAEAHVRADRTMLPARAAAARGAGAALAAEIILETQWTEPCPRGIGCQQQGDAQPRRLGEGPTCLGPAPQFPAAGGQVLHADSSNSLDTRGARLRQWRAWRAPDEMA